MQNDVETILEEGVDYIETYETSQLSIKPKYYKQTYRSAWEQMPDFKGWLRGIPGQSTRAYCTYCDKSLHAHRLSLLKHTCTIRHQKAAQINFARSQRENSDQGEYSGVDLLSSIKKHQEDSDQENAGTSQYLETVEAEYSENTMGSVEDEGQVYEECMLNEEEYAEEDDADKGGKETPQYRKVYMSTKSVNMTTKPPISTHVLDTSKGAPVAGLQVSLYKLIDGRWTYINESITNPDGRSSSFLERGDFTAGRYKLHYDVDRYFELRKQESLYPFIEIVFDCRAPVENYHIPLLLTPFGYTTYRGS